MVSNWEAWSKVKRTAVEWLAVFISAAGFLFSVVASIISLVSLFIAYQANEELELLEVRYVNLQAVIERGK